VVEFLDDTMQGYHIRMRRSQLVECDLSDVDLSLSAVRLRLGINETFHGVRLGKRCTSADGSVNDAISSNAQDLNKFERIVIDERSQGRVGCGSGGSLRHDGKLGGRDVDRDEQALEGEMKVEMRSESFLTSF
jgi:hypothetical protein